MSDQRLTFLQRNVLEMFNDLFNPYLRAIGSPVEICRGLGIDNGAQSLIKAVYRGRLVPDWPFVRDVMKLAEFFDQGGPDMPSGPARWGPVQRRYIDIIGALGLSPQQMSVPGTPRTLGESEYRIFEPATGTYQTVLARLKSKRPVPRPSPTPQKRPVPVEPVPARVCADAPGYSLKPDPMTVHNMAELQGQLREFWRWADRPSMRDVAARSGRAFSKSTVTKLLHEQLPRTKVPELSQKYVAGIVRGCGGDEQEIVRWVTAFRLLDIGKCPASVRPYEDADGIVTSFRRLASSQ